MISNNNRAKNIRFVFLSSFSSLFFPSKINSLNLCLNEMKADIASLKKDVQRGVPLFPTGNVLVFEHGGAGQLAQCKNCIFQRHFQYKVISPHYYGIYTDDLIKILRNCRLGCHLIELFLACINCIFYADDLALMAPLRSTMQIDSVCPLILTSSYTRKHSRV